jgi:hypothetical protein
MVGQGLADGGCNPFAELGELHVIEGSSHPLRRDFGGERLSLACIAFSIRATCAKCTTHLYHRAGRNSSAAGSTSPRHASEMFNREPVRPLSLRCLRKLSQLALSS